MVFSDELNLLRETIWLDYTTRTHPLQDNLIQLRSGERHILNKCDGCQGTILPNEPVLLLCLPDADDITEESEIFVYCKNCAPQRLEEGIIYLRTLISEVSRCSVTEESIDERLRPLP